ncbi:MAG: hypothetical protein OFPII_33830 [Osedax symbiont Rs1]|nr:MAG: hypothetical protein OFPII_33830 [Osedax symbiont Rs1]
MKKILLISFFSLILNNAHADSHAKATEQAASDAENSADSENSEEPVTRSMPNTKQETELEIAAYLSNSLTQVLKLTALEQEFNLYYLAADVKEPLGSLLFFPDERLHSDTLVSLNPLRVGLTRYQWQTAVLTLPQTTLPAIPLRSEYKEDTQDPESTNDATAAVEDTVEAKTETAKAKDKDTDAPDTAAQTTPNSSTEEPPIAVKTLAEISLARAQASIKLLTEKSDAVIIAGIGQGATWAAAFAVTIPAADKENFRLLLINPLQSTDVSAPKLTQMLGDIKIDTFDIYTPHNANLSIGINPALARKRAANLSEIEQYIQIKASALTWGRQGNSWLLKKVRGVLKKYVEKPLIIAKEKKTKPKISRKKNQKPGV